MAVLRDRLLAEGCGGGSFGDDEVMNTFFEQIRSSIDAATVVVLDKVAERLFAESPKVYWDFRRDFPNLQPMFPNTWLEWKMPNRMNFGGQVLTAEDRSLLGSTLHIGVWMESHPRDAFTPDNPVTDWCKGQFDQLDFTLTARFFLLSPGHSPVCVPALDLIPIGDDTRILAGQDGQAIQAIIASGPRTAQRLGAIQTLVQQYVMVPLLALSAINSAEGKLVRQGDDGDYAVELEHGS